MADATDIAHLLRRTEFVARAARVAELAPLSIDAAVDDVLDFTANANPQVPADLQVHDAANSSAQMLATFNWWLDSMATRPRPFQEKMTLFWHGHFTTEWDMVGRTDHMTHQNQLYRTSALGNYLTLAQQMSIEPAMLLYLSNAVNVKAAPNQNFARELMELFLLGVGNYTEDDVAAASRAWTGHNYNTTTHVYEFRATKHDTGTKTFFGTTKNWDGPDIINEILRDNVAKRLVAARFIARKLWTFLAYPGPADNIVNDLGDVLIANNMELRPLVRALLLRPEFYTPAAKQGLVRTPTEWATALLAGSALTSSAVSVYNYAEGMGQTVFNPPNVAGWKNNSYWLTTSAASGRATLAKRVAALMRANGGYDNLYALAPGDAVDFVAAAFSIAPLADSTRAALAAAFAAERAATPTTTSKTSVTNLLTMVMLTGELNVG
ncbi:MAG: hypothetical protein JWL72_4244 [Ilumatobacteraceae bacterium]|nr:hypothetical protein [Ilumatobacteraceae bacterium]MCU1390906.1 hypothetical protein [Ilumatobacteraceae bacterium]